MRQSNRRDFLKAGVLAVATGALAGIPIRGSAATNAAMRSALKYQTKPEAEKQCANCLQFVPGANPTAPGGCKIMPGDTEISPQGYCVGWTKK